MIKHVRTKHPIEYQDLREDSSRQANKSERLSDPIPGTSTATVQPTLMQAIDRKQSYRDDSDKKKELDLLMKIIVKNLHPLSMTDDKEFKDFVRGLNPRYELPSRRVLTRTHLPNLYEQEVAKISKELEGIDDIALTTDIWTSRQTQGFITVTAHFVSNDFTIRSVVLETARITKCHTAENIAEELTSICEKWKILDKIFCVVTDNAANMTSAIKKHMKLRHLPCFAHTLNLVVQEAMKNSTELLEIKGKVKKIVNFFPLQRESL